MEEPKIVAERIVEIRLDDSKEGGMNLRMDEETIDALKAYGRQAGKALREDFDFDENRWRRALSVMPAIEEALDTLDDAYTHKPVGTGADGLTYAAILTSREPGRYPNTPQWRKQVLEPFVAQLVLG